MRPGCCCGFQEALMLYLAKSWVSLFQFLNKFLCSVNCYHYKILIWYLVHLRMFWKILTLSSQCSVYNHPLDDTSSWVAWLAWQQVFKMEIFDSERFSTHHYGGRRWDTKSRERHVWVSSIHIAPLPVVKQYFEIKNLKLFFCEI